MHGACAVHGQREGAGDGGCGEGAEGAEVAEGAERTDDAEGAESSTEGDEGAEGMHSPMSNAMLTSGCALAAVDAEGCWSALCEA